MKKVICECGHENPYGTELCESCGKPLKDQGKGLVNMRYEGAARRSQTYSRTIVDKIWNFFSSVKVGVWIIVLTLIASSLGTVFPQEMFIPPGERASVYYQQEYGTAGQLFYQLGFHNLYSSWWYMLLVAGLATSLIIASIDRFFPLYRALKNQRVTRHPGFMKRQRLYHTERAGEDAHDRLKKAGDALREKRYRVREENGNLLAEKGRFSRWGPYVNHIGLIIFLIGATLRLFPEMYLDDHIWVREGQTVEVKGTGGEYSVRNEEFLIEFYDDEDERFINNPQQASAVAKTYQTTVTLFQQTSETIGSGVEPDEVEQFPIRVNNPLTFDGFSLYQVDFKLNELSEFTFAVEPEEGTDDELYSETIDVNLYDPETVYEMDNGFTVEILEYFPNYVFENNEPGTLNRIPDNPRFIVEITPPGEEEGEMSMVGIQVNNPLSEESDYRLRMVDFDTNHVSALAVRRDRTIPILIAGGIIFMIGLVQGAYWHHRRIWIQERDGELLLAGHANKNWNALKKDFSWLSEKTGLPEPADQAEKEETDGTRDEGVKSNHGDAGSDKQ
ncbi:cytochrome c biogenesis protein ResB [Alteribacter natronophilus]|uniref:cytochrome c biogenesis protein ResB n=1 Tax=Alteribacter natronophilus TaxID=2583810 RepID=UPI00110F4A97|nr:cytochrome c biogenesis protein ResB [Alteribacter natronophilus]TMW73648.1 cytochrome C biogenesis protein [Alteribacter natronophilus]